MKIILLANWGIGLEVLKALTQNPNIQILSVITQYEHNSSDPWFNVVYNYSINKNINTIKQDIVDFDMLADIIKKNEIDLLLSHAYMKILPVKIIALPKLGSVNIHPSLLPKYRGPSPTQWVIKNKEKYTGLTCHYIDEGVDSGDIIYQVRVSVVTNDTVNTIIEKMKKKVQGMISESLSRIIDPDFKAIPQGSESWPYASKINK